MSEPTPTQRVEQEVNVQAVPTLKGLRHYLDYQHPSTRGDIQLNKICNEISQLATELKAAQKSCIEWATSYEKNTLELRQQLADKTRECKEKSSKLCTCHKIGMDATSQQCPMCPVCQLESERDQLRAENVTIHNILLSCITDDVDAAIDAARKEQS